MSAELVDVTVWVLIDEDGDYVAECDPDVLKERYEADVGEWDGTKATRMVKVTVKMPRPKAVELVATIGDEPADAELKVA